MVLLKFLMIINIDDKAVEPCYSFFINLVKDRVHISVIEASLYFCISTLAQNTILNIGRSRRWRWFHDNFYIINTLNSFAHALTF